MFLPHLPPRWRKSQSGGARLRRDRACLFCDAVFKNSPVEANWFLPAVCLRFPVVNFPSLLLLFLTCHSIMISSLNFFYRVMSTAWEGNAWGWKSSSRAHHISFHCIMTSALFWCLWNFFKRHIHQRKFLRRYQECVWMTCLKYKRRKIWRENYQKMMYMQDPARMWPVYIQQEELIITRESAHSRMSMLYNMSKKGWISGHVVDTTSDRKWTFKGISYMSFSDDMWMSCEKEKPCQISADQ